MKWFKHMSNSHRDKTLKGIFRKHGLEGEARFWRLVELMAEAFENDQVSFDFELEILRESLRFRSLKDCRSFLDTLTILTDMIVEYSGNDCRITYDKLLDIKDNHTKNLQVASKKVSKNLPLELEEEKERELEEEVKEYTPCFDSPITEHPLETPVDPIRPEVKKIRQATDVKDHKLKWFMDLFNDLSDRHGMVKIKALSPARSKLIEKGINAIGSDPQTWEKVFMIAGSKGFVKSNGDSWTPEFDYIFTKERYIAFSEADAGKKIIKTTNEDLFKQGFDSNPWRGESE